MTSSHTHNKAGIACSHVVRRKRPLMLIAHDASGVWQFMCGKSDHTRQKQAKKVCTTCAIEDYAPGITADEIPPGHMAERRTKTTWEVRPMTAEEVGEIDASPVHTSESVAKGDKP